MADDDRKNTAIAPASARRAAVPSAKRVLQRKVDAAAASGMTAAVLAQKSSATAVDLDVALGDAPASPQLEARETPAQASAPAPEAAVEAPSDVSPESSAEAEPSVEAEPAPVAQGSVAAQAPAAAPVAAPEQDAFSSPADPVVSPVFSIKDITMDMSANFSGFQSAMTEAQAKAKAAFEKSTSALGEAGEFAKGNVEAMIESGKIYSDGLQEIGSTMVAEGRTAFEAMTGDIKELAAAKSPTDFLKIQSDMVRKNFDSAVAYSSKNSETFLKLMSDAMAPLSGRMSLAVEKARTATVSASPMASAAV